MKQINDVLYVGQDLGGTAPDPNGRMGVVETPKVAPQTEEDDDDSISSSDDSSSYSSFSSSSGTTSARASRSRATAPRVPMRTTS